MSIKKASVKEGDLKSWSEEWKLAVMEGLFVRRDFEGGQMSRDMTILLIKMGKLITSMLLKRI